MSIEEANSEEARRNDEAGCDEVRKRLIELAYDDFAGDAIGIDDRAALERHVSQCAGCRDALSELRWTRDLVARAAVSRPTSVRAVHAGRVQRHVAELAQRGQRRWRRLAWLATAAALLVCVGAISRLRVEIHPSRVVFAWGDGSGGADQNSIVAADPETMAEPRVQTVEDSIAAHQRRLAEINRLLDLMVTEMNRNSARIEATGVVFARRIDAVERQNNERWRAVGRGFHDWYLKQTLAQATLPPGVVQGEIR
jgi:hypothetical protein